MTGPHVAADDTSEFDDLGPMERTIQSTIHQSHDSLGEDQPIEGRPRDATGKFVSVAEGVEPKPGEWIKLDDAPVAVDGQPAEGTDPAAVEPVIPEGHVALPALAPEKVQGFRVLDAEGEIVPPDLKFEVNFRGPNGESQPRTLDLPRLVNYARQGAYNHERDQQASQVRTENGQLFARVSQADQQIQQMQQERVRMLSDVDYFLDQVKKHEEANTPEARQAREREEIDTQRQQIEYDRAAQHNMAYLDTQVAPWLDTIAKALPSVTLDELAHRLNVLIEPYKVRTRFGVILNPNATKAVEQTIINQLVPWAQQIHMDREDTRAPAPKVPVIPAKPQPNVAELQVRAAKARRLGTAPLRPVSGNAPQGAPASQKAPQGNREMGDFIVGKALAGLRGG